MNILVIHIWGTIGLSQSITRTACSGMDEYRIEKDSLGEVKIPKNAYWGAQTQRANQTFPVSGKVFPLVFIRSLGVIKHACASVNHELHLLESRFADAVIRSCEEIMGGKFDELNSMSKCNYPSIEF